MKGIWIALGVTILLLLIGTVIVSLTWSVRRFSIVLLDQDGLTKEDISKPEVGYGSLYFTSPIPHKYILSRKAYTLEILVNPKKGDPVILQISARGADGSRLNLSANWSGPCGTVSPDSVQRRFFFLESPGSVGFMWAPYLFCPGSYPSVQEHEDAAKSASRDPIGLVIRKPDGSILGQETVRFKIAPNGYKLYGVVP